jgi:hypothetical protein
VKRHALVVAVVMTACAQHPAYTIGVATGVIGFGACAVDEVKASDCLVIGALTGVVFGVATALIYHFTDSNAHELRMDESLGSGGVVQLHTFTPPPPVPLEQGSGSAIEAVPVVVPTDAGVAQPPVDDAPPSP